MRAKFLRSFVLFAPLLAAIPLARLPGEPASLGRSRPCARAQLIDGELRCDEEAVEDTRESCPFGEPRPVEPGDTVFACVVERMSPDQLAALAQIVDINSASVAELASLPGIGPVMAERIVAGRPYASVDAVLEVRGIGPARLAALRPRARIKPRSR